jgi:hypothetical protein
VILECACGKMYRVRDEAPNPPTKCPVCGGPLKAAGGSSPNLLAEHPRFREMDARIRQLEKELEEARAQAKPAAPEAPVLSQAGWTLGGDRAAAERADRLERDLLDLRSRTERQLKDKDRELAQAREALDREAAERRRLESRASGLEESHARTLQEKQKTLEALDASLASYRSKLEDLQKRLEAAELQRLSDLNAFETRIREREQKDGGELQRLTEAHQRALSDLREELERKIAEKDRLLTEGRQNLDREAGERRRLSEVLSRLQETADRTLKEKEASLQVLQGSLASYRAKVEALQRRVDDLEQLRRSEQDATAQRLHSREGLRARLEEAGHLATDLDHSLEGMDSLLRALRERVKRLQGSLEPVPSEPQPPVPAPSLSAVGEPAAEPVVRPQAPAFEPATPPPGRVEPPSQVLEPPAAEETASEEPALDPAPEEVEEDAPAALHQAAHDHGERLAAPEVAASAPAESAAEPEAVAEEPAPAPEAPKAEEEVVDAVPLISPPEEDEASEDAPKKKGILSKFFGKKR